MLHTLMLSSVFVLHVAKMYTSEVTKLKITALASGVQELVQVAVPTHMSGIPVRLLAYVHVDPHLLRQAIIMAKPFITKLLTHTTTTLPA